MKSASCRWVQHSISRGGLDALCTVERARVDEHLSHCIDCQEFAETADALGGIAPDLYPEPLPPLLERRTIMAALDGRLPERTINRKLINRFVFVGVTAAVSTAVVVISILGLFADKPKLKKAKSEQTVADIHKTEAEEAPVIDKEERGESVVFPIDGEITPLVLGESKIWGAKETALTVVEKTAASSRVRLKRGKIVAEVDSTSVSNRFVVVTKNAHVEVRGTIFSVEVTDDGSETVRVSEGLVAVTDFGSGLVHLLSAHQQLVVGEPSGRAAEEEAISADLKMTESLAESGKQNEEQTNRSKRVGRAERKDNNTSGKEADNGRTLLRQAKMYRKEQKFELAKKTYAQLIKRYPESNAAANAIVALAQMEIGVFNDSVEALKHFETYLRMFPAGVLSDDAWIGKMRILRKQGHDKKALSVSTNYLTKRPRGAVAPEMLRLRGDIYVKQRNCDAAMKDYQKVMDAWPGSKAARRAQAGYRICEDANK